MIDVIGIGANVADTIAELPHFPPEDTKLRATTFLRRGGGPCATGLVAAAKLGQSCMYLGNFADDPDGAFLKEDMGKYGVSTELCQTLSGYRSFASQIWLNKEAGTRTIVFDKGTVPPLVLSSVQKEAIVTAKVLMVDGNDLEAAIEGAAWARAHGVFVLYDAGGLYEGVECLLPLCDILIPSEEFAKGITGKTSVEDAAVALLNQYNPKVVVITCGARGGVMVTTQDVRTYPVYPVEVVDSNGAGDVFHGAFAAAICRKMDFYTACHFASCVSALKCTGVGARENVPDFDTAIRFMNEKKLL